MPNFNRIFLLGNLTHDPQLTETASGVSVTNFSLATHEKYRKADDTDGERVCFVDIVTWDTLASQCAESLAKGSLVLVEGRLDYHIWEDNDGQKRSTHQISAFSVQFLSPKPKDAA